MKMWIFGQNPIECVFTEGDHTISLNPPKPLPQPTGSVPAELPAYIIERMQYEPE